eukprot:2598250-Amphidinium_carterae.5
MSDLFCSLDVFTHELKLKEAINTMRRPTLASSAYPPTHLLLDLRPRPLVTDPSRTSKRRQKMEQFFIPGCAFPARIQREMSLWLEMMSGTIATSPEGK